MTPDILMKGVVASYLATPQGMEMVHNHISSNEGRKVIREYLATPRGRQKEKLKIHTHSLKKPTDTRFCQIWGIRVLMCGSRRLDRTLSSIYFC